MIFIAQIVRLKSWVIQRLIILPAIFEGEQFRSRIIKNNPENIHLGNMGYYLAVGKEDMAKEELYKHLQYKVKEALQSS